MIDPERWILKLYIAGHTPRSRLAIKNLEALCQNNLAGQYELEVIDLLEHPTLAKDEQIVALPTLVRQLPPPIKQIVGDLSDTEKVLVGLDLRVRR